MTKLSDMRDDRDSMENNWRQAMASVKATEAELIKVRGLLEKYSDWYRHEVAENKRLTAQLATPPVVEEAVKAAYEVCAKVAERHAGVDRADNTRFVASNIAAAIRSLARSATP